MGGKKATSITFKSYSLFIYSSLLIFFSKLSIIKLTTLNTNGQKTIGGIVVDPVACVISMPTCS